MKTPEEIKKKLRSYSEYYLGGRNWGREVLGTGEVLAAAHDYIDSLEKGIDQVYKQAEPLRELQKSIEQLERERDALLADLTLVCGSTSINICPVCGHWRADWEKPGCELSGLTCAWCWRGVQNRGEKG